jgi:uncharacterized protein YkwD
MTVRRRGAAVAAAALVLLAGTPSLAAPAPAPPAPPAAPTGYLPVGSWQLLAEVNQHRRSRGLVPLKVDPAMAANARAWSEQMARSGVLAHNDAMFTATSRQRLGMRLLGENVGWNLSVAGQHKAFMTSPAHRRNIDHAGFRTAGLRGRARWQGTAVGDGGVRGAAPVAQTPPRVTA